MGDTVSNHNLLVMNKGSKFTAKDTVPDFHFLPNWAVAGFPNTAKLKTLGANKTTRTKIKDEPICVLGSRIGPKSDALHAGKVNKGVISRTHREYATAITFSPDLFCEKKPAVRHTDLTFQNKYNTLGKVIAGEHTAHKESYAEYARKKCNLQKFDGKCGHGRKLGWLDQANWGKGEATYLEVLLDEMVDFWVERFDITKEPNEKSPDCVKNHTSWRAEITQFPTKTKKFIPGKDSYHHGESFFVKTNEALHPIASIAGMAGKGGIDKEGDAKPKRDYSYTPEKEARDRANMSNFNYPSGAQEAAVQEAKEKARARQDKENRTTRKTNVEVDITDMFKLFAWMVMPPTIDVKAIACSGAKKATIKVYPKDEYTFTFKLTRQVKTRSPMAKIRASITAVKECTNIIKKAVLMAGQRFDFAFLEGFKFEWKIQYKEHTKFHGALTRVYTPATVGQDWSLEIASDPLVRVSVMIKIPLARFLGPVGAAAAWIADKVGTRVDVEFGADLEVAIGFLFGWDEYKVMKRSMASFTITISIWAALVAAVAGVSIRGQIKFPASGTVYLRNSRKEGCLAQWNKKWSVETHIDITAKAWGIFKWKAYEGRPKFWKKEHKLDNNAWGDLFTTA